MAANDAAAAHAVTELAAMEKDKLAALPLEQQELYLLSFTQEWARNVAALDKDAASEQQAAVLQQTLDILHLQSPPLNRVVRKNLANALGSCLGRSDRRLLIEAITKLIAILTAKDSHLRTKHAAVLCLGAVMMSAGDTARSSASSACSSILKCLKLGQQHTGLRNAVYTALASVVQGSGGFIDHITARDLWKSARSAAYSDKAFVVQASACCLLARLVRSTNFFDTSSDLDRLLNILWKASDSPSRLVRHAVAEAIACALVKAHSDVASDATALQPKKSKKTKKNNSDDQDPTEQDPTSIPAAQRGPLTVTLTLNEIMHLLSTQYSKSSTSNKSRATIVMAYKVVLSSLGNVIIEKHYSSIVRHLINDLLSHPNTITNRYRSLLTRRYIRILLHRVLGVMLGERAHLNAARSLLTDIIGDYSSTIKERTDASKHAFVVALSALVAHMETLEAAFGPLAESCRETLLQVIQHPSYTVQIHAACALRALVSACPQQLLPTITLCMNSVAREADNLNNHRQSPRRCNAFASGLAALLKASSNNPLYGSVDVYVRVLDQASKLLKASGTTTLRVSSTQVSMAWTIMGGLMSLGPSFVKSHLSQLLLLWRNALPPPPSKDEMSKRTLLELGYLAHVRECSLAALSVFLHYNGRLITTDVAKRIATMLENTTMFLNALPIKVPSDDPIHRLSPALQLQDLHDMLRRRLYHCCSRLIVANVGVVASVTEYSIVMGSALMCFADPGHSRSSSLSTSISSSAGNFISVWDVGDNWAFGVTGNTDTSDLQLSMSDSNALPGVPSQDVEAQIDELTRQPIGEGLEHDSVQNYLYDPSVARPLPQPPITEAINAAIHLFALILPTQSAKVQVGTLEQITAYLNVNSGPQIDPARRSAVRVNIATTLLLLTRLLKGHPLGLPGKLQSGAVEQAFLEILHVLIVDTEEYIRRAASEALSRLCGVCGSDFTGTEVTTLIDLIVSNRESSARAGCALALSYIYAQLGGMAASYHLNNIVGVLMSLAADPNPTVHYWALDSLCRVIQSAGLTFSSHVSSSIGLLSQLYVRDTHNIDTESSDSSNLETTVDTMAAITRCIGAIVNVLGPDLEDLVKPRNMVFTLLRQLDAEIEPSVVAENMRCWELASLYAPSRIDFESYVWQLQQNLDSTSTEVRQVAIRALADTMRRDAAAVISIAKGGLEDKFWDLLDSCPNDTVIHEIFLTWLQQSGLSEMAAWVQRCFSILSRIKSRPDAEGQDTAPPANNPGPDLQDEEVAGFAAAAGAKEDTTASTTSSADFMRWQVRLFAMDLMTQLLGMVYKDSTTNDESPALEALQQQVGDVIKIAFSASTADVGSLRIKGLHIIDQILKMFGATPDPDFNEAMLLEQYHAQISSALTPAFAADSSPELAAEAINVCATFISTGIVTEIDRMGRILKLLVSSLETFSVASETASIGDLRGLSSNANVMVRMAVYAAWAELQNATGEHAHLEQVVKPHVATLLPLWLSSLQEYARLRFEPDVSDSLGTSQSPDVTYAALNRETILQFYQEAWLKLVEAIASLIDEDSEFVFDALENKSPASVTNGQEGTRKQQINYRDEPAAFFFVLFGLAFEALAGRVSGDAIAEKSKRLEILGALLKILRPSITGVAIYQEVVFSETMDLFDRMVLTEGLDVQSVVVEIARNLCITHPSSRLEGGRAKDEEHLSDDIEQLFELTRIMVLTLTGLIPGLAETNRPVRAEMSDEAVALVRLSLEALVDAADAFPSIIQGDLHACILHLFATILATGPCQTAVVPQALPIFKRFVASIVNKQDMSSASRAQLSNTLGRFMTILHHAQKRETSASLPCEKNTILASTILVTTAQSEFGASDPFVQIFIDELVESIDSVATSTMAAGCARSLLLASCTSGKSLPTHFTSQIMIRLVGILTGPPAEIGEIAQSRVVVAQSLVSFACAQRGGQQRSACYAVVVAALLCRLERAEEFGATDEETSSISAVRRETAARLLELAGADHKAFRATIVKMDQKQKSYVEGVLRAVSGRNLRDDGEDDGDETESGGRRGGEPSIALKLEF